MKSNNSTNKQKINEFVQYRKTICNYKDETINQEETLLVKLSNLINKPFQETTKNDIITFLSHFQNINTKNLFLTRLKQFYKWLYNLEPDDKPPECVRIKNPTERKREQQNTIKIKERIITINEYHELLRKASTIQHKAILETLWFTGARASELLSMRIKDFKQNEQITTYFVEESKTKPRTIPINDNPEYLIQWINDFHPYRNNPESPLWLSNSATTKNKPLTYDGLYQIIYKLTKKTTIKKTISPHDFRHTAITRDIHNGMILTDVCTKYGWIKSTEMLKFYDHNDLKELIHHLKEDTEHKPKTYATLKKENTEINNLKKELHETKRHLFDLVKDFNQLLKDIEQQNLNDKLGIKTLNDDDKQTKYTYDTPTDG